MYSLFVGEDLRTLLNGYVDQAKAMSMLFAAAGGLIEAQDEAVAAALGKAAQEPAGLQSLGLMGSLGSTISMLDAAEGLSATRGYDRVGPEEVSGAPLARMVSGAQALDPAQFEQIRHRLSTVATSLGTAAGDLKSGLGAALGSQWQGEFAAQASTSVGSFTESVDKLATALEEVVTKASTAEDGFRTTKTRIGEESLSLQAAQANTPGFGYVHGPPTPESAAAMEAAQDAAEEQARSIVNTVYSPAVMDSNLADLDIPNPYRVVSTSALAGASGLDLMSAWNVDGVVRPAGPAAPGEAALAAAGGMGAPAGAGAVGGGEGTGATTTSLPTTPTDAATEQALLASRASAAEGGGAATGTAGQAGAGGASALGAGSPGAGGVNASTHAAATPFAPVAGANGQPVGAGGGAAGARGIRNGSTQRDRGFGPAAGMLGGGAVAAGGGGAGAARMGGAGTLAGLGGLGGPGAGGPGAGAPGAGALGPGGTPAAPGAGGASAGTGSAGSPAGALSSSSSTGGAQAGRAGMMPMGMMGAAGAGQNEGRRGHTPAGYLTNATNASEIIGEPVKVAPAVLGRAPRPDDAAGDVPPEKNPDEGRAYQGRVIGRRAAET
ncbi:WXG100 family type VII secretion target [Dietzia sp. PP-33]|uniref:WXG100 family type VII secretion target n=1 Tax=Dietzia sp. PP-33 TaxID=2957500 RepID=UPI0029A9A8E4|nr:WXG100 family type VII secretion target [Dietzia sp. PP-33]MDX2358889.1 WXG100 family type VII secretion target [Dietzia sp. PP-33]